MYRVCAFAVSSAKGNVEAMMGPRYVLAMGL